ncbi:MAG TPA: EAL domain-containing protein [Gaiellaceae bacterium]|nr:EAL domain-containing protein [Gaiellaceae bacterium]
MIGTAERLARIGTWEWDLESDELLWSENMYRLLGVRPGEVTPSPEYVLSRMHPADRDRVEQELDAARREGRLPNVTYRVVWADGGVRWLRSFSELADSRDGRPLRMVGAVQDVTELVEAQRATAESLTLFEALQESAPIGFALIDRELRVVRLNSVLAEVNGAPVEEQIGRRVADLVPDIWPQMEAVYRRVLETGEPVVNLEVDRVRALTQDRRHWLASYYPVVVDDEVIGVGVIVTDVTERAEAEHFRSTMMDTMVEGLYALDDEGRVAFMNSAAERILGWSEDELRGKPMHELVHFQHADGSPNPAKDCPLLRVRELGKPTRRSHEAFTRKDGTICPVSYSAAPLRNGWKSNGVVVVFRDNSDEQAEDERVRRELDTLAWVGRIRDAIDQGRLMLYSQPIVPLAGGQPSQELLLRMIGANGEVIAPGSFLPVAEKYGMIAEIDRWVISQAARVAGSGQHVEANLSAGSISDLSLLTFIEHELRDAGADPGGLVFEITETALMKDVDAGKAFITGLTDIGCRVALDDFGTGFASFTYLKTFNPAYLKVDVDFVRDLPADTSNQHLVRAIARLAKDFGYETIAEGVEDAETLTMLLDYGIDFAQGFHLGRPSPTTSS